MFTPFYFSLGTSIVLFLLIYVNGWVSTWQEHRAEARQEEFQLRRLEILSKMDEPSRQRLIASMPDWLDPDDKEDLEAWKKARAEVIRVEK